MWFTVLLIYCAISCLAALVMTRIWASQFAERAAAHGISAFRFQFGAVLIAPIAMPFVACAIVQHFVQRVHRLGQLRRVLRTTREYEFAKVNSLYLAEPIRRHWEKHTPSLFQLGFELLGDYRMKPQPVEVYDRFFLSADGQTVGDVCCLLGRGSISFISVLSDGTCVHTTSIKDPRPERTIQPADQLCLTYLPDTSAEDLHQHHQTTLRQRSTATPLHFQPDQLRSVLIYDQRIFNRWRFRHGDFAMPPPAPDFSTLRA